MALYWNSNEEVFLSDGETQSNLCRLTIALTKNPFAFQVEDWKQFGSGYEDSSIFNHVAVSSGISDNDWAKVFNNL